MSEPKPAFYIHREIIDPATGKLRAGFDGAITWCDEPAGDWLLPVYLSDPARVAVQEPTEVMPISVSEAMEAERWRNALVGLCDTDRIDTPEQAVVNVKRRMRRMGFADQAQHVISGYTCTVPDDCETLHWRGQILSMNELASVAQPAVGEEIHVHIEGQDVLTLPLASSGMGAPRFVVHVPAQQPVSGASELPPHVQAIMDDIEGELEDVDYQGSYADGIRVLKKKLAEQPQSPQQPVSGADGLPDAEDILGCAGISRLLGDNPAIFGTADIVRFAHCVLKHFARPQPAGTAGVPIELQGVSEAVAEGDGFWRSCSGCHELNEGHDTGPQSKVFKCALGNGCSECGGIGAIWDTTDYDEMGDALAASMAQPQPSGNAGEFSALPTVADQAINAAYVRCFGSEINWLDTAGSYFVEGYRAALAHQASGQDLEDPLQPAANWLVNAANLSATHLAGNLCIGINRAQRLYNAARAAAKEQS